MRPFVTLLSCILISGCALTPATPPKAERLGKINTPAPQVAPDARPERISPRVAVRNFLAAVAAIEPVAEAVCAERAPQLNCDFRIVVDDAVNAPPNAFQTVDDAGRPIIAFTVPLIAETRNRDELAFILAHEAAHHIAGHLAQQRRNATIGASILGGLVSMGNDPDAVRSAQQLGAAIGARTYSKEFELEADALGTVIAARAGFDPLRGAEFFFRIPDPGDSFLGTHPANADRLRTVQRVVAELGV